MEFFVTGTGTGVGKTFVTALLSRMFVEKGLSTAVQKWVSTGGRTQAEDIEFIVRHVPELGPAGGACARALYCLEFPASPHLAAEMEDITISSQDIAKFFLEMRDKFDILMVEGAGGVMVPLTRQLLLIDLVKELGLCGLVVAAAGLGTINHTLLTIEALEHRGIPCVGVVLNSQGLDTSSEEHPAIVEDNARVIEQFSNVPVLGVVPRMERFGYKAVAEIGERVLERLHRVCA